MKARTLALGALLLAWAGPARAASCLVNNVVGVAFGSYDTQALVPLDSTGSVTVKCSSVNPLTDSMRISLDRGSGVGATLASRKMTGSKGGTLGYNLYLDATRLAVWGDGTAGTAVYGPVTPPTSNSTISVYGRIPAQQAVSSGTYSDSVVVTVTF